MPRSKIDLIICTSFVFAVTFFFSALGYIVAKAATKEAIKELQIESLQEQMGKR